MISDTIAAIATPLGEGGVAIVRVSGDKAVEQVEHVFRSKTRLTEAQTHTIHYGHIINPNTGDKIEEVLVSVMRAPRSFTTEDVVEINCHGGIVAVKRVMDLLLEQEIRVAEPGEFTKRAFLNGRIDLTQAEAVIDLIRSKSDRAFQMALKQVDGSLSKSIGDLRFQLVELMAHIEVNIDYPEHDVEEMTNAFIRERCVKVSTYIDELLRTAEHGKILREGIVTAIIGKPNVGKSSLLNTLAQENRAIVTDIPGTTRDVIEEYVNVGGIPLKLLDTAGIRETTDLVEQIGVERSKTALSEADLILLVLNSSEPLDPEELVMIEELRQRQTIVILNKTDLPSQIDREGIASQFPPGRVVALSLLEGSGLADLEKAIASIFFEGKLESTDLTYVSNVRHIGLLKQAKGSLREAMEANDAYVPIDMIQIDIRAAWEHLGEIIGDSVAESLIDQIFSQFCLGK
ncbi:tRNA uridine-5-carboxymethylaminomethyl(34) synthesis GTPase MnmE [Paenibacillus lutrae]|uniref:tRNA modification GTPase MnmE n=1 Tax=Paenibacillus lutrae TaxID=2078573 RepID=A0A7X3FJJ5_9BACL|nr:tRNA uridine-5-carboxymethylaminomethyl(34) synthesis GTPase MnmE [Paenibacillus lutrae]MVP00762.1 tRNA uridine-5-carboxymethylaminomethyl(34) synthesis GTPase MnmE [Paenibacillus lutrae]